jgi:hypothetical protein
MRPEEFSMLVDEHAQAWKKVGFSSSGIVYDPNARYDLEEAREQSRKLVDAFRAAQGKRDVE